MTPAAPVLSPMPVTAGTLATGDCLLQLGDLLYPQALDPEQPPVVVAATRPPEEPIGALIEVVTSTGRCYTDPATPALVHRSVEVTAGSILLISRRASLHSLVCTWGFPVVRRTPITFDQTAHPVTPEEWQTAALIVIDGFLRHASIAALWRRGDLRDRRQIVLLCTDPDDARTDRLAQAAHARTLAVLPYDLDNLIDMFKAATGAPGASGDYGDLFNPEA